MHASSLFTDVLFFLGLVEIEVKILTQGNMNEQDTWLRLARDNFSFAYLLVYSPSAFVSAVEEKDWQKKVKIKTSMDRLIFWSFMVCELASLLCWDTGEQSHLNSLVDKHNA